MYSYKAPDPARVKLQKVYCKSNSSVGHVSSVAVGHMVVEEILGVECVGTVSTSVGKCASEVHVLHMLSQVSFVVTDFSAYSALESLETSLWVSDYVRVKLLVPTLTTCDKVDFRAQ